MWLMNSRLSPKDQQGFAFSQATCPFYATFERRQAVVPSSRKSSLIPLTLQLTLVSTLSNSWHLVLTSASSIFHEPFPPSSCPVSSLLGCDPVKGTCEART